MRKRQRRGHVYILESTRRNGRKMRYVGQTGRSVYIRVGEHIREVKRSDSKTWVGRGIWARLLGSFFSQNRFKAERTMKRKWRQSPYHRRRR